MKSLFSQSLRAAAGLPRRFILPAVLPWAGWATAEEGAIPAPVTAADFSQLLEHPPFRRSLSLSESMVLSGVAVLPDGPMVTLWNRSTGESFVVGNNPNAQGWKLLELSQSSDLRSVTAVISAAGQELTIRFDPESHDRPRVDADLQGRKSSGNPSPNFSKPTQPPQMAIAAPSSKNPSPKPSSLRLELRTPPPRRTQPRPPPRRRRRNPDHFQLF